MIYGGGSLTYLSTAMHHEHSPVALPLASKPSLRYNLLVMSSLKRSGSAIGASRPALFYERWRFRSIRLREERLLRELRARQEAQIIVNYLRARDSLLDSLCDKHGSDKGGNSLSTQRFAWKHHTYTDFLSLLFEPTRQHVKLVFECGIGTNNLSIRSNMGLGGIPGASLRVWRDYFPNAKIIGADIDESVLFEEDRIQTYALDQRISDSVEEMWKKVGRSGFDLMIDDGLHAFEAGKTLFLGSVDRLAPNGRYIIEDVFHDDMIRYMDFFSNLDFRVDFVSLVRPRESGICEPIGNNQLILIRHPETK